MRNLRKALLSAVALALFLTSPLCAQSSGSAGSPTSQAVSQQSSSLKSTTLLQDLRQALALVEKSNREIASLKLQLATARSSSDSSAEKISSLERQLEKAEGLRLESQETIKRLERLLTEAGITVEQQKKLISELRTSLDGALTESKQAKETASELNDSVKRDAAKIRGLEIQRNLLVGGTVVAFTGGIALGIFAAHALAK